MNPSASMFEELDEQVADFLQSRRLVWQIQILLEDTINIDVAEFEESVVAAIRENRTT